MSHRGVEIVLGRLATDEAAQQRFRESPAAALAELAGTGLELNAVELAALAALTPNALRQFADALDPRLRMAAPSAPGRGPSAGGGGREL